MENFITSTGQSIFVHDKEDCKGEFCCIHNPSNHHMVNWPLYWRSDRRFFERIDPEGICHPDPDDIEYHKKNKKDISIHGCNGLCHPDNYQKYIKDKMKNIDWKEEFKYFLEQKGILEDFLERFEDQNLYSFYDKDFIYPYNFISSSFDLDCENEINWEVVNNEWIEYYNYWKEEFN